MPAALGQDALHEKNNAFNTIMAWCRKDAGWMFIDIDHNEHGDEEDDDEEMIEEYWEDDISVTSMELEVMVEAVRVELLAESRERHVELLTQTERMDELHLLDTRRRLEQATHRSNRAERVLEQQAIAMEELVVKEDRRRRVTDAYIWLSENPTRWGQTVV